METEVMRIEQVEPNAFAVWGKDISPDGYIHWMTYYCTDAFDKAVKWCEENGCEWELYES